jgi:hypothetical protein
MLDIDDAIDGIEDLGPRMFVLVLVIVAILALICFVSSGLISAYHSSDEDAKAVVTGVNSMSQ